jgi:hypothetical protein
MTSRPLCIGALLAIVGFAGAAPCPAQPVAARRAVRSRTVVTRHGAVHSRTVVRSRTVAVRPYRSWVRRPYYGLAIGAVTLGTIYAVSSIPVAPAPGVCWYWSNRAHTRGYWDYC